MFRAERVKPSQKGLSYKVGAPAHVHAALAPGERLLPGAGDAAAKLFDGDPRVDFVLVALRPQGDGALARAARRYMAAWDARLLHRNTFFAPGARVLSRSPFDGWRAGEVASLLARAIDAGRVVEALPWHGVATDIARDLGSWTAWAREEGAAWGALSAREPRFRAFAPASWMGHNVWRAHRRVGEVAQATRRADPLVWVLHATREAAWTREALRAL